MPLRPRTAVFRSSYAVRFFVEPIAAALNCLLADGGYRSVYMVGLSGGGWTTTLYAAIDPRVRRSYPVAGSLPQYLRKEGPRRLGTAGSWVVRDRALSRP